MPIFGPKCQFWAKFGRFWARNPIFGGQGVKILVLSYRESNETPFSCWKHWSVGLKLAAGGENVLFWPQNLDIWGQKSIFCLVIAIFVDGTNDHYTRGFAGGLHNSNCGVVYWIASNKISTEQAMLKWQKSDFLAKNWNFGPKKRRSLLYSNHVLATTGKSLSKKKVAFSQIIKGENVILSDFLG